MKCMKVCEGSRRMRLPRGYTWLDVAGGQLEGFLRPLVHFSHFVNQCPVRVITPPSRVCLTLE